MQRHPDGTFDRLSIVLGRAAFVVAKGLFKVRTCPLVDGVVFFVSFVLSDRSLVANTSRQSSWSIFETRLQLQLPLAVL